VFKIWLPSNGNTLVVGQEIVFAGTCSPSCSIATGMHDTVLIKIVCVKYSFPVVDLMHTNCHRVGKERGPAFAKP
jgi:hypothetical protein